jgi:hypothetical protein
VYISVAPDPPKTLLRVDALTDSTRVTFIWSEGDFNGGQIVTDYRIYYDQGTNIFILLASGVLSKTFTLTPATAGVTYQFKV